MTTTTTINQPHFGEVLADERSRLLGLCTYLTGDPDSAEDVVQEVMLEAWRSFGNLRDPTAIAAWLNGIVRNVYARWQRTRGREAMVMLPDAQTDADTNARLDTIADDFDLEVDLEQHELAMLLDRALALLPATTRAVLIGKYIAESPHAELAAQLGLNENALAVRLHRGKLALHRVLTTNFRDEAMALGLVVPEAAGWQSTRIWCFYCGQHYLQARFNRTEGHLCLRCPGCCNSHDAGDFIANAHTPLLRNFKTIKPAFNCAEEIVHAHYIKNAQAGIASCFQCGKATPIRPGSPPGFPVGSSDLYLWCEPCQTGVSQIGFSNESWGSLALSLPEVRHFWQRHPRMHLIPPRQLDIANIPAVVTGFESRTSRARIEVGFAMNTFELIYVEQAK